MIRAPAIAAVFLGPVAVFLSSPGAADGHSTLAADAERGLAFAQQRCSGCHAVVENRASPEPEAPSFEEIANRPGVTATTLREFLRDSHNFPQAMNFRVEPAGIADLAAYVETLRKADYRPVM